MAVATGTPSRPSRIGDPTGSCADPRRRREKAVARARRPARRPPRREPLQLLPLAPARAAVAHDDRDDAASHDADQSHSSEHTPASFGDQRPATPNGFVDLRSRLVQRAGRERVDRRSPPDGQPASHATGRQRRDGSRRREKQQEEG